MDCLRPPAGVYVAGGGDDNVHIMTLGANGTWGSPDPRCLGPHRRGNGLIGQSDAGQGAINLQVGVKPCAAGVAISTDGKTLVVANYYNDSITVFTGGLGHWATEGNSTCAGRSATSPRPARRAASIRFGWCKGERSSATAYVSSIRDPRDRRGESERGLTPRSRPGSSERPAEQDDAECGPVAPVCRRRPVGYD